MPRFSRQIDIVKGSNFLEIGSVWDLFSIRRVHDDIWKKSALIIYIYSTKKRASRASTLRADKTQHTRGLVLTPCHGPVPPLRPNLNGPAADPRPSPSDY